MTLSTTLRGISLSCDSEPFFSARYQHDMDRDTADKGVDKTAFIILSLVTDKQVWVFFFFTKHLNRVHGIQYHGRNVSIMTPRQQQISLAVTAYDSTLRPHDLVSQTKRRAPRKIRPLEQT